jgi:hypothetical protein
MLISPALLFPLLHANAAAAAAAAGTEASAALKAVMEVLDMSGQDEQEPPEVRTDLRTFSVIQGCLINLQGLCRT